MVFGGIEIGRGGGRCLGGGQADKERRWEVFFLGGGGLDIGRGVRGVLWGER